jgi:O-glycosyl hydrolase
MTASQADLFFSQTNGIGLSLLRNRITPDGATDEINSMQAAQARGALVWSTPMSPPAAWKSNNDVNNGGSLLPSHYQDYANQLADYVQNVQTEGVNLDAISIQNEPDWVATGESCIWTASQLHDFVAILGPTFAQRGLSTRLMLPEQAGWNFNLAADTLNDPTTAQYVSVLAGHYYNGAITAVPQAGGRRLWETEVGDFSAFDPTIASGLTYATQIYNFMTIAQTNAWNYWWLLSGNNDNEGLLGMNGELTKRLYAVGNYSKFIRPGYFRIGETDDGGVLISAYKDLGTGKFVIVAVNSGAAQTETFNFNGFTATSVTPWVTSAALDLAQQSNVAVSGGAFTYTLPGSSVTTFVGTAPISLTASAGNMLANLSWTASSGATSYNLYRATTSGGEGATPYRTGLTGTAFTDTGLTNGTTYYYQVSAVSAGGESSRSAEASATPVAPGTVILAIDSGGPANGSFIADTDFNGGNTFTSSYPINTSNVTNPAPQAVYQSVRYGNFTYTIPNLAPSASYTVRLHFAEIAWNSAGSRVFNVAINGTLVLSNFDIYAAAGSSLIAIVRPFTATATSAGQIVIQFTSIVDSADVGGIEIITAGGVSAPPAPTGLTATAGNAQVTLNWTASTGATSYNIYRSTTSGGEGGTPYRTGVSTTSFTDTGLTDGTTYYYQVTAVNSGGESPKSSEASATPNLAPPAAPTNVTATAGNTQVTLNWTASTGATSYNIYRSTTSGGEGSTPYRAGVSSTSFTDTGLTNGTTYFYQVTAVNGGGESPKSSEASATPNLAPPAAPTNVTATASNTQVTLNWTASTGATSYNIYRSTTSGGEGSTPYRTGVSTTSFTDTGLTNGTTYFYQVTAVNGGGESPKSSEASATPQATGSLVLAIDAGGAANGSFVADTDFVGGNSYTTSNPINTSNVVNPAPQAVYRSVRYGNFTYTIPNLAAGAAYTVRLHFAEVAFFSAGARKFNVTINGTQVLSNFDIFAAAGGPLIAIVEQFNATANASGQLVIQFVSVVENADVSGIEILTAGTGPRMAAAGGPQNLAKQIDLSGGKDLFAPPMTVNQPSAGKIDDRATPRRILETKPRDDMEMANSSRDEAAGWRSTTTRAQNLTTLPPGSLDDCDCFFRILSSSL